MSDGEVQQLRVEGEDELEHDVGEGLAHDITGHQDVIVHPATLDVDLSDGDLGGKVGLGPGHDVNVCFLLDFVVTLGNEVLGKVDGSSACQVQVRVQPSGGDDIQGGRPPAKIDCKHLTLATTTSPAFMISSNYSFFSGVDGLHFENKTLNQKCSLSSTIK